MHDTTRVLGLALCVIVFGCCVLSLSWHVLVPFSPEANRWLMLGVSGAQIIFMLSAGRWSEQD